MPLQNETKRLFSPVPRLQRARLEAVPPIILPVVDDARPKSERPSHSRSPHEGTANAHAKTLDAEIPRGKLNNSQETQTQRSEKKKPQGTM